MMRGSSFAGSLLFAVLAALGAVAWMMATAPVVGSAWALGLYSLGCAVVHLIWIAPSWSRGFAVGTAAGLGALITVVAAPMPIGAVMGAAVLLAAGRSGFLFRGRPARAIFVEGALVVGGLVFARALVDASWLSLGFAFWGFFLIQSLYFLIGGFTRRSQESSQVDPFEAARQRALTLMEREA